MSRRIYIPTRGAEDWRGLLADPAGQWRAGFSARCLAEAWEAADGFPAEVAALFTTSGVPAFRYVELLLALPEHPVALPPRGGHASQNDLFALGKAADGALIAMTIEGKAAEPFGPTLAQWQASGSGGKSVRLSFIREQLGLPPDLPPALRYQLLHRAASAVVEARRFNAAHAALIVHSFSPAARWLADYRAFVALWGAADAQPGRLVALGAVGGVQLWAGWARGADAGAG